jgi:hypothetical protein
VIFNGGVVVTAFLSPGTYVVHVSGWSTDEAQSVAYRLYMTIGQIGDNPTPLTVGAAPALSIRLVNSGPPAVPPVVLPPVVTGSVPTGLTSGNALPSLANLLPTSLLANGAIGGVPGVGVATASENAVAQVIPTPAVQDVLQLIVLTQLGAGPDENDDAAAPTHSWIEPYVSSLQGSVDRLVDTLFRVTDWLDTSSEAKSASDGEPGGAMEDTEMEDGENQEVKAAIEDPFAPAATCEDHTWAGAVFAIAWLQVDQQRRSRKNRLPHPDPHALACA